MFKLNKAERYIVYCLLAWTAIHMFLWVFAHGADYSQKDQFWPFVNGGTSVINDLWHTYDFREFVIYTFVPWTLFFMGDGLFKVPSKEN